MSTYKHEGQHLNRQIVEEIVKDTVRGTDSIANITRFVLEHHTNHGGLSDDRNLERFMRIAMSRLESEGYAKQVSDTRWEIYEAPLRVFGEGSGAVYVYYDSKHRVANHSNWVCKVGSHHRSEIAEVRDYIDSRTTNWATRATLALILKTDTYERLEKQIRTILKDVFNRQHEREGRHSREMFYTSPDHVIKIYKSIRSNDGRYV